MGVVMPGHGLLGIGLRFRGWEEVGILQAERYSTVITKNKERTILRNSHILATYCFHRVREE